MMEHPLVGCSNYVCMTMEMVRTTGELDLNWFKNQGQNVDSPCQMSITVR